MNQPQLDLPDPDKRELSFSAMKATQPIGDLYLAVIDSEDLGLIANFDVRRVLQLERDVERYLGIQRPLNEGRVRDLTQYVTFADATFPTSIIIAISDDYAEYNEQTRTLTVRNFRDGEEQPSTNIRRIARVLDGQHRIMGLYGFDGPSKFELPVTVFIGSDISDQAYIFATVNLEQTKVSKSLAYDLFALAKTRSPQRTCHNIAVALDADEGSPFYRRIKRLGVSTPGRIGETLTQATFVLSLLPYISDDPKGDRDMLLRAEKLEKIEITKDSRLIFRNMFIDERDLDIANILFNYFTAVRNRWKKGWMSRERGQILHRTSAFRAFMQVLRPLYLKLGRPGDVVTVDKFAREFSRIEVETEHFTTDNYLPGTSGEVALRNDLLKWLDLI